MSYKCEHCGEEVETEMELDVEHRACRLKAAFSGAYTEQGDGLVTFDMKKVSESLWLFNDIVIGRDGQPLHPLEGDLHFRIRAGWLEPEVWIELPVQVGNHLSSWTFCIKEQDWLKLVKAVDLGLEAARKYLEQKPAYKRGEGMGFQIGHLQYPDKAGSEIEDYWKALAEAERRSIDDSVWAVWTGQKEGSELMAIVYGGTAYTR